MLATFLIAPKGEELQVMALSLCCVLHRVVLTKLVCGTSSEENGILIGRFLIHVVLTQWNVRLEKHDQKMDKKLVGQQGFPFRALEIRIVLISRYIHIELVGCSFACSIA